MTHPEGCVLYYFGYVVILGDDFRWEIQYGADLSGEVTPTESRREVKPRPSIGKKNAIKASLLGVKPAPNHQEEYGVQSWSRC